MTNLVRSKSFLLLLGGLFPLLSACAPNGAELFHARGCINCHSFQGKGGSLGPDLTAVTERRDDAWIKRYIHDPRAVNPEARMPAFPDLSSPERQAIVDFLKK